MLFSCSQISTMNSGHSQFCFFCRALALCNNVICYSLFFAFAILIVSPIFGSKGIARHISTNKHFLYSFSLAPIVLSTQIRSTYKSWTEIDKLPIFNSESIHHKTRNQTIICFRQRFAHVLATVLWWDLFLLVFSCFLLQQCDSHYVKERTNVPSNHRLLFISFHSWTNFTQILYCLHLEVTKRRKHSDSDFSCAISIGQSHCTLSDRRFWFSNWLLFIGKVGDMTHEYSFEHLFSDVKENDRNYGVRLNGCLSK